MCTGIALRALEASGVSVTLSVCGALVRTWPRTCCTSHAMLHAACCASHDARCLSHVARRASLVAAYILHVVCCTPHVVARRHAAPIRCGHPLRQVTSLEMNGLSFSLLAVRISAPPTGARADEGGTA